MAHLAAVACGRCAARIDWSSPCISARQALQLPAVAVRFGRWECDLAGPARGMAAFRFRRGPSARSFGRLQLAAGLAHYRRPPCRRHDHEIELDGLAREIGEPLDSDFTGWASQLV